MTPGSETLTYEPVWRAAIATPGAICLHVTLQGKNTQNLLLFGEKNMLQKQHM